MRSRSRVGPHTGSRPRSVGAAERLSYVKDVHDGVDQHGRPRDAEPLHVPIRVGAQLFDNGVLALSGPPDGAVVDEPVGVEPRP